MRILSLCSGDGRDLLPELAGSGRQLVRLVLVERDEQLVHGARTTASQLGLGQVNVIAGDAGACATFAAALPVDLLMLCGIFGNVSNDDIAATIAAAPAMLRPGATVIWTRGSTEPELRCVIRQWFVDTGFTEVGFDSEPDGFGVGVAKLTQPVAYRSLPRRLFTFVR
jgi:hypothetical protein